MTTEAATIFGDKDRLGAAFLVAPLLPGVAIASVMIILGPMVAGWGLLQTIECAVLLPLVGTIISGLIGYPVALLIGLPVHVVLRRAGFRGAVAYGLAGAGLGALAWPVFDLLLERQRFFHLAHSHLKSMMIAGVICGMCAGVAFWRIARPDLPPSASPIMPETR